MAKRDYRDADVFDCKVRAHKTFFEDEIPVASDFKPLQNEDWPSSMPKTWTGTVYEITGFNGQEVDALLSLIVNDKDQFKKGKTFYLLIRRNPSDELQELFRLKADPRTTRRLVTFHNLPLKPTCFCCLRPPDV